MALSLACQTPAEYLDEREPLAIATAERLGRSVLECPRARATVLSRRLHQPALLGGASTSAPIPEYELVVNGCGGEVTYRLRCRRGSCHPTPEAGEPEAAEPEAVEESS